MTTLILILLWLLHLQPAMSDVPQPVLVILNSKHFIHMLRWEPGPGTPIGVHYRVTVRTETGTSAVPVVGCELVQNPLGCNLTEAFSNPREVYYTQITALLEGQESRPVTLEGFKPITDTDLDLPLLTVEPCGEDLCVDLEPPMEHLREIYDSLHYKLRIESNNAERTQDITSLRGQILKDPVPGRQYCVSVRFSDRSVLRESNYSRPVCTGPPDDYTADLLISAVVCMLVIFFLVVTLLVRTGFISLTRKPLPSVLTSIRHIEEAVVLSSRASSSSLLTVKPIPPSSGEKRSNQTSDDSDGESVTEITAGSRRGGGGRYKLRRGTNLLSSSSSSLSSLSARSSPEPESPSFSSNQTSVVVNLQPEVSMVTETPSSAASRTRTASDSPTITNQRSDHCPADGLTVGRIQPKEEEEEEDSQDVNLLTLTFDRLGGEEEEEEEEDEEESSSISEVDSTILTLPSQTEDTKDVAIETISCSVDEEEEDEHSGYIGHRCPADVLSNLF